MIGYAVCSKCATSPFVTAPRSTYLSGAVGCTTVSVVKSLPRLGVCSHGKRKMHLVLPTSIIALPRLLTELSAPYPPELEPIYMHPRLPLSLNSRPQRENPCSTMSSLTAAAASITPFTVVFDSFWAQLKPGEVSMFQGMHSVKDVYEESRRIQLAQAKTNTMANINRIRPYLDGLNRYSEVMSIIIQVKPELMSLIWGPIKLVLQAFNNHFDTMDKVIDIIELIGKELPLFQRTEAAFATDGLFMSYHALFYREILDFHLALVKISRHSGVRLVFDALWPRHSTKFTAIHGNIRRHREKLQSAVNILVLEECLATRERLMSREADEQQREDERKLKEYLDPFDYGKHFEEMEDNICPATGEWIFKDPTLSKWMDCAATTYDQLVWLTGIPGAGKSHIAFQIQQHLKDLHESQQNGRVICAFATYTEGDGNTRSAIIRSLTYQLAQADSELSALAVSECKQKVSKLRQPADSWREILKQLLRVLDLPCWVILDGIDECERRERKSMLDDVRFLVDCCPKLRILVSSRREGDICQKLYQRPEVVVEQNNTTDIQTYINMRLDYCLSEINAVIDPAMYSSVQHSVKVLSQKLGHQADGLFLYVKLILDDMDNQPNPAKALQAAQHLPRGLDQLYERILNRIFPDRVTNDEAKAALSWLISARRPLREAELECAVCIRAGETEIDEMKKPFGGITELCGPLVKKVGDYILLVHFSAQEYITGIYPGPRMGLFTIEDANFAVTVACMGYLAYKHFVTTITEEQIDEWIRTGAYALLDYASSYWLAHLTRAFALGHTRTTTLNLDIVEHLRVFFEAKFNTSVRLCGQKIMPSASFRPLAAKNPELFDQLTLVATHTWHLWMQTSDTFDENILANDPISLFPISRQIQHRLEALHEAPSKYMHDNRLKLQKYYGNIYQCPRPWCSRYRIRFENRQLRDEHTATHQQYMCQYPDCEFHTLGFSNQDDLAAHTRMTHETRERVDTVSFDMDWATLDGQLLSQYLLAAANSGQISVVQSLLAMQRNLEVDHRALLMAAVVRDSVELFNLLFPVCSSAFTREFGAELLKYAIEHGKDDSLSTELVTLGVPLVANLRKVRGYYKFSAIHCAIVRGWESFVTLLLDKEAGTIKSQFAGYLLEGFSQDYTPLQAAVLYDRLPIIELLLRRNAHPDLHRRGEGSALHFVKSRSAAEALISHGANVNLRSSSTFSTALQSAVHRQRHEVCDVLISHPDIDINAKSNVVSKTALYIAVDKRNLELVTALAAHKDIKIDSQNADGATPLCLAVSRGDAAIVKELISSNAIDAHWKEKALYIASESGEEEIVKLLITQQDFDINSQTYKSETSLLAAARSGHSAVIAVLSACDSIDLNPKDRFGRTPLILATEKGHKEAAEILAASYGVDINSRDDIGRTALSYAAGYGYEGIVKNLVAHRSVNVNLKCHRSRSPLTYAASNGHGNIIRILANSDGNDINSKDGWGKAPLISAAANGHVEAVEILAASYGVDINARDEKGRTALWYAASNGYRGLVKNLIALGGINLNLKDWDRKSPLAAAAAAGRAEVVAMLAVCDGIDLNSEDAFGVTPLMAAAKYGRSEVVRILVAYDGVDINFKTKSGYSALQFARGRGDARLIEILLSRLNADVNSRNATGYTALDLASESG